MELRMNGSFPTPENEEGKARINKFEKYLNVIKDYSKKVLK